MDDIQHTQPPAVKRVTFVTQYHPYPNSAYVMMFQGLCRAEDLTDSTADVLPTSAVAETICIFSLS